LFRRKDIIGKKIIDISTGNRISNALDILVNIEKKKVIGVITENTKIVLLKNIKEIGEEGIFVNGNKVLVDPSQYVEGDKYLKQIPYFPKPVIDFEGNRLGVLNDITFNLKSGSVLGFLISDSLIKDLFEGLTLIQNTKEINISENYLCIPSEIVCESATKIGGIEQIIGRSDNGGMSDL
jgi:uncharacterized protein YrrD